jgi:hypothetical protein
VNESISLLGKQQLHAELLFEHPIGGILISLHWNAATEQPSKVEGGFLNLFTDANAEFTNWVVKAGILLEPFVLVDIGVQGGENPSWHRLGDYLIVHGFDALEEAIDQLRKQTERAPNRHYSVLSIFVASRFVAIQGV